jgi:tight adherence protein B
MRKSTRLTLALTLVAAVVLSSTAAAMAQTPAGTQVKITQVDNSKFPQVTVYVSVIDSAGNPVGIDPSTIQLTENGKVMQPTFAGGGKEGGVGPLSTMLVMDVSGSMDKNGKIDGAKAAASAYVKQMRSGDQAGIITFNTRTQDIQPLTQDHDALLSAINGMKPGGNTAMYDALIAAEEALKSVQGRKAIITVTDGLDNSSSHKSADVLAGVGAGGLSISTIGLGDPTTKSQSGLDEAGLKSLADQAGGGYSYAGDAQRLSALFESYGRQLQSEYVLTYTSPETLRDGVNRNLEVSLAGSGIAAQKAYNPGGVLPEVPTQSWLLFGGILAGLVLLLLIPWLVGVGARGLGGLGGGGRKKGRVKLGGSTSGTQAASSSMARGRVKIK